MRLLVKNKDNIWAISSQDYDFAIEPLGGGRYQLKAFPNHINTYANVITIDTYNSLGEATAVLSNIFQLEQQCYNTIKNHEWQEIEGNPDLLAMY